MSDQASSVVPTGSKLSIDVEITTPEPDPLKGGDVYKWAMDQVALIRAGRYQDVDWVNVSDEIESVGKSEFRSLASHLEVVLTHILKWDHQPAKRSRSWVGSIDRNRIEIQNDLADNPSLNARLEEAIERGYRLARYGAAKQTRLLLKIFPVECPYDWDAIMNRLLVLDQANEDS